MIRAPGQTRRYIVTRWPPRPGSPPRWNVTTAPATLTHMVTEWRKEVLQCTCGNYQPCEHVLGVLRGREQRRG